MLNVKELQTLTTCANNIEEKKKETISDNFKINCLESCIEDITALCYTFANAGKSSIDYYISSLENVTDIDSIIKIRNIIANALFALDNDIKVSPCINPRFLTISWEQ